MILGRLIPKLHVHFPEQFHIHEAVVTFPAKHPAVSSVEVHDDGEELTVYAGNFSHLHFPSYDSSISKEQAAELIAVGRKRIGIVRLPRNGLSYQ